MKGRLPLAVAVAGAALSLPLAATAAGVPRDDAAAAWTIFPPGADASARFGRNTSDQAVLYDGLTALRGKVTAESVRRWFKPAPLGLGGRQAVRRERPRKGVVVDRDPYGVAHVTGTKAADVAFGAGWVTAADRGDLLARLRGPARLAVLDAPGLDPLSLALSGVTFVPSAETEAFVANQIDALRSSTAGRRIFSLLSAYVAGLNAWYARRSIGIDRYTVRDVVAALALVGDRFAMGGGHEVENAEFLAALRERLGTAADAVFSDLRQSDDPEAPVSVPGTFRQGAAPPPSAAPGSVVLDDGSFDGATPIEHDGASSAILIGARRSATKHPLFVAGPQIDYLFPALFTEIDLEGGGFSTRGVLFPGMPFVFVGRGPDFAWSASSSHADTTDVFVETLCDGSRHKYELLGRCLPMRRVYAGVLRARGRPDEPVVFYETAHGPVLGYAKADGVEVGISARRSTRGREVLSIRPLWELNTQRVTSATSFTTAVSRSELPFDWFYADDRDIAMFSSGRLPIRAPGTSSSLPTIGTGGYDWRGFVRPSQHAQAVNPRSGAIVSWNNRPAAGIVAADSNASYGAVHRVELLREKIAGSRTHTLPTVVAAMNESATQDLRAAEVWPVIREVLGTAAPPTDRAEVAAELVDGWRASGASRIDADLDGAVDAPGAAVLDASWSGIADAVMTPVLGDLTDRLAEIVPRDDPPGSDGSAFLRGWYGYVDKDLRSLIGRPVRGAFATAYCGAGSLAACARSLWAAVDEAAVSLEQAQGSDPDGWRVDARSERIGFGSDAFPETMRWTNRPTFQQVMSFAAHRPRR